MKLYIKDKIFANFSKYVVDLIYDAVASTFRFESLRDILPKQLEYYDCKIYTDDNILLISGNIINDVRSISARPQLIGISGYSYPGILEDCNIPPEIYPLQSDYLSLKQICDKILPIFEISYKVDERVLGKFNKTYKKQSAGISMPVKSFLNTIASQAGIIMTHNELGELLFTDVDTNLLSPSAIFEEGNEGIEGITLGIEGQALHSHITIMKQTSEFDKSSGQETVVNPLVKKYRPKVKASTSGSVFDMKEAARMELSKELSSIKFQIETKTFVKPGNIISLKAPSIGIDNSIEIFVERTNIRGNKNGERYILTAVLKEVYDFNAKIQNIFQ